VSSFHPSPPVSGSLTQRQHHPRVNREGKDSIYRSPRQVYSLIASSSLLLPYNIRREPPGPIEPRSGSLFPLFSSSPSQRCYHGSDLKLTPKHKKRTMIFSSPCTLNYYTAGTFTLSRLHFSHPLEFSSQLLKPAVRATTVHTPHPLA